jgi:hypothetical protein
MQNKAPWTAVALVAILWSQHLELSAQQFLARNGEVSFTSSTPVEDIAASSKQMSCILDASTGAFAFQIPIRSFHFEKALMEEHFNENYMESAQFPNGIFKGNFVNWNAATLKDGKPHPLEARGELTIHGVTVQRTISGTITWKDGKWVMQAQFKVPTAAHEIAIPDVVKEKIAKEIQVNVNATLTAK